MSNKEENSLKLNGLPVPRLKQGHKRLSNKGVTDLSQTYYKRQEVVETEKTNLNGVQTNDTTLFLFKN